jgi:hypothetical protein
MSRTALNIFATAKPSRWYHGKIEPMSREDAEFWKLRRERERKEQA